MLENGCNSHGRVVKFNHNLIIHYLIIKEHIIQFLDDNNLHPEDYVIIVILIISASYIT